MITKRYGLDSPQLQAILPEQALREGYQATQEILQAVQAGELADRKKGTIEAWIGEVKAEQKNRRTQVERTRQFLSGAKLEAAAEIYRERYTAQLDQATDATILWIAADLLAGDRVLLGLPTGPWVEVINIRLQRLDVQASAVAMGRAVEFTQRSHRGKVSP